MRGKDYAKSTTETVARITPAHAGKRHPCKPIGADKKDHPRACGEKLMGWNNLENGEGSPPRMRGKAALAPTVAFSVRITPAHAGKSNRCSKKEKDEEDHPRACGEKSSCEL